MAVEEKARTSEVQPAEARPLAGPQAGAAAGQSRGGTQPAQSLPSAPGAASAGRNRTRILLPVLAVIAIVAIVLVYRYIRDQSLYVSTDNAQVNGALIQVGSVNAGRIATISVDVGSNVTKGEVLAEVTLPSTVGVTAQGTPQLGFQGTQDQQAPVVSPINGVVVQRTGNPGDTVAQGTSILTVVDPTQFWITANVEETNIKRVQLGQTADVTVDTQGTTLTGRVIAIDRSTASSFSLLPTGTTAGNFTKVTQLVPVKISINYGTMPLVLGSSVEVRIHVQ